MATIKDVAALSGVSVTTVSRVLNKRGYISEDTYKKVYDAMAELNYQPNQLARSLSKQKYSYQNATTEEEKEQEKYLVAATFFILLGALLYLPLGNSNLIIEN